MKACLAIAYENKSLYERALALSAALHLPIDNEAHQKLLLLDDKLALKMSNFLPLYCDFSTKTWQTRRDAGKKQGLVQACKPSLGQRVIDATAGWGRDAAILASFGSEVLMLERQPVMAALLRDGLERQDEPSRKNLKLKLCEKNALDYLQDLEVKDYPDLIYIDPMHPERQKKALVKKDMQALQQLIGVDKDAQALVELALKRTLKRVVVKWPQSLPPLLSPDSSVIGKVVRFDIYLSSINKS